jgi:hypothetical protein
MKTGHGVIQGYNGQAVVDEKHQFIAAAEAFGKVQDSSLLKPVPEKTAENYKSIGKSDNYIENKCVIADTGYFSEDNLTAAGEKKIDAFIRAEGLIPRPLGRMKGIKSRLRYL